MRHHVEEAKKRRNEKLRRTRGRQTLTLLTILLIIIAGLTGGYFIYNADFWLIESITVAGNHRLTAKQIVDLAEVDYQTSLLKLPAATIEANLKKNPWIQEVALSRAWPDRLTIEIRERTPFVGVKQGDKVMVLDKTGFVILSTGGTTTDTSMPIISDIKAGRLKVGSRSGKQPLTGALKSLGSLDADLKAKVTWVSVPSLEKLTFQTVDGLEIVYGGPNEAAKKNFLIKKILAGGGGRIVHINVTAPDNPVVRKLKT